VAAPAAPAAAGDPLLAHLATGLGLPADTLAGRDPAQAAAQVGALARAAVTVLRQLLDQQAQGRRQMGSRAPALLPVREVNPLRLAATPEAALRALLAPGSNVEAPLQRTAAELAAHQDRMMAAFRGAATRLGEEMSPASLEKALGASTGMAPAARLWELYLQLWQGIGLASDQPWTKGFVEAALLHLAAAYDEHGKP
jgi:predicted component of type VI protein secretion system